tara:strand:+ start:325 stop:486 length:162 start_codon:yes stop_codon:yes gene_type:complete
VTKKKGKTYKGFIRDLVYNNPRADRQFPDDDEPSQDEYDRLMLYDTQKRNKND